MPMLLCYRANKMTMMMMKAGTGFNYRSMSVAGPQQQTRRPPLLVSIDGTDRRTDRRTTDRFMTLTAYYAGCMINGDAGHLLS